MTKEELINQGYRVFTNEKDEIIGVRKDTYIAYNSSEVLRLNNKEINDVLCNRELSHTPLSDETLHDLTESLEGCQNDYYIMWFQRLLEIYKDYYRQDDFDRVYHYNNAVWSGSLD